MTSYLVSVDISLTPSLSGPTLPLSLSLNKRILGDFIGLCFFSRIRSNQKEGVTRISESRHTAGMACGAVTAPGTGTVTPVTAYASHTDSFVCPHVKNMHMDMEMYM